MTPLFHTRDNREENPQEQNEWRRAVTHVRPRFEVGSLLEDVKGGIMGGLLGGLLGGLGSGVSGIFSSLGSLLGGLL